MQTKDPFYRNHQIRDAIGQAIYDEMAQDKSIYLFGEGAQVKVHYDHPDIERDFGNRVVTLPISEDGNVNFAVGASLLGVKPVVDIITADFLYRCMDSICNTSAKLNFVLPDSEPPRTIVIRAEFLIGGPCLLPGTRVWYNPRPEPVGTQTDTHIYGGNGKSESITRESWYPYKGRACTIKPCLLQPMNVTEEHPFYIARIKTHSDSPSKYPYTHKQKQILWEGWAKAKDLTDEDYLVIPKLPDIGTPQHIKLVAKDNHQIRVLQTKILEIDEKVASFLGWYVAEGSSKPDGNIYLTLNKDLDPIEEIRELVAIMGYSSNICAHGEHSINLNFKSRMLAPWLAQHAGKGAHNKRIPVEIFDSPNHIKMAFLLAYLKGDGNVSKDSVGCKTASESLWYDLTYLMISLGIIPSTSSDIDQGHYLKTGQFLKGGIAYRVRVCGEQRRRLLWKTIGRELRVDGFGSHQFIEQEGRFLVPVRSVVGFEYEGPIFNVEPESHTYLMPVVTHNTTGQRPEALFIHIPGLNVVIPSTPKDAYGLMRTALETPGVTIFFEDRMIIDSEICTVELLSPFPDENLPVPFGRVRYCTHPEAAQLTLVSYGLMRQVVEGLLWEHRLLEKVELLDLQTLYPLDDVGIEESVARTGKLLIVEPDVTYGGVGAEIVAQIAEHLPGTIIRRLGAPRETIPASRDGQARMLPSRAQILEAIRGLV